MAQTNNKALLKNEKQKDFLSWKFGMFLHFNMGTFVNREHASGYEDPLKFNPKNLNCEQWAKEAKNAGMKYMVLTVKHTGGWCLWDSKYTSHDITAFKNYENGKGDIVRDYVKAARKYGLKVGLYYCLPGNYSTLHSASRQDTLRGYKITKDQEDLHGLPPEAKGNYAGFIEKQVAELLSNYGTIDLMWFDQFANSYTKKDWPQLKALVHKLQPKCIVLANNARDYEKTDVYSYEYPYLIRASKSGLAALPSDKNSPGEVSDCIATTKWFWNNEVPVRLQSATEMANRLKFCNDHNTNYLLNVQPDNEGLISEPYLSRLRELGKLITKNHIFN